MEYLDELNDAQRAAVTAPEGPMIVIAGAGSGKTRVLTMRIAYLLSQGVMPYNILALTFTNKAAREMKERIAKIVGYDVAQQLWMGTFHSIFARILRYEAHAVGFTSNFTIYDTQDSKSLIRSIIKAMQLDEKNYKPSTVLGIISASKNELITPQTYAANDNYALRDRKNNRGRMAEVYARYVAECHKANAMDFDDLLLYTNVLFRDNPDILAKYQQHFSHILVDEYQDTNHSQYIIIKRLAEQHHNICVVGDDSQSIYSFRGARIENILRFAQDYNQCKMYKLEQNYRSTQNIVNAANSLISNNINRLEKKIFSENEEGDKVRVIATTTDQEEAKTVCEDIASRMRYEGLSLADFAILYRTNAQSRSFEEAMRKNGLNYRIYGGLSFFQRKEVKDLLAYLRLTTNSADTESLKRIVNYPIRGIGATTLSKIEQFADTQNITLWEAMQAENLSRIGLSSGVQNKLINFTVMINEFGQMAEQKNAYDLAVEVLSKSGMMADLKSEKNDAEGKERLENISEMLNGIQIFCSQNADNEDERQLSSIEAYLADVALLTDQDTNTDDTTERVTLMTIHSSKGLEFDNVYVVGVEEELFPGPQSIGNNQALEEERRLFYVAITRARKCCTITYTRMRFQYGKTNKTKRSRFIAELSDDYVVKPREVFSLGLPLGGDFRAAKFNPPPRPKYTKFNTQKAEPQPKPNEAPETSESVCYQNVTYSVGQKVEHATFGCGVIVRIENQEDNTKLRIDFGPRGVKQLLIKFARLKPLK